MGDRDCLEILATRNSASVYACDSASSSLPSTSCSANTLAPTTRARRLFPPDMEEYHVSSSISYTNACLLIVISQVCAESDVYPALFLP